MRQPGWDGGRDFAGGNRGAAARIHFSARRSGVPAQVEGKGDAIKLRNDLATMVESLALRRRRLQHAADGEFPHTDPANAGMRKKFDLPANRPLNA